MEEICEAIGATPEELVMAMDAASDVTCIDDLHAEICGTEDGDRIVDRLCVSQLLDTLTPDERKLVVLRYFQDKTQGQTGQILGMSQVQVSRLEKRYSEDSDGKYWSNISHIHGQTILRI